MNYDATLAAIAERVNAHAGLRPPAWVLAARVRDRMRALGLADAAIYLAALAARAEIDALVEELRVGETRFFRHQAHVGALRRLVVPAVAAARSGARGGPARLGRAGGEAKRSPQRVVRAWSAGCASGEEAYTLAMILADGLPGFGVDVLATDISEEALATARAGVYAEAALEPVPPHLRARWFRSAGPGRVAVAPELAAHVRFERRNLVDGFPGDKDVILCRNVLIYFDAEQRAATARRLAGALAPGGFLFVGYAETLRGVEGLEALRFEDGLVYRRRTATEAETETETETEAEAETEAETETETEAEAEAETDTQAEAEVAERTVTVRITGSHEAPGAIAAELRQAIERAHAEVVVDLDGVDFLDDSVAPVLRRAEAAAQAAGLGFRVAARRPGPRRFLARHGIKS